MALLAACTAGALLAAAEVPAPAAAPGSGPAPLRVGTALDSYPYSFTDAHGRLQGFAIDLLRAVEREAQLPMDLKPVPNAAWAEGFARNEYDVHGLLVRTPERLQQLDFTAPYLRLKGAVFVRADSPPVASIADLRGRRIVVHRASAGREFLERNQLPYETADARNVEDTLRFVSSGRYDATLAARLTALSILRRDDVRNVVPCEVDLPGYELVYGFAVRKGDQARLDRLNEGLALVHRSGEFDRIYEVWFGHTEPGLLTREQAITIVSIALALLLAVAVWAWRRQHTLRARLAAESATLDGVIRRAGCVLWSATITERPGGFDWRFREQRGALGLLGRGPDEPPREDLYTRDNAPDYDAMNLRAESALRAGAPGYEQEFRFVDPTGTRWLAERVSLTPVGPGRWDAAGVIVEVTRLKTAENEVRRLNETLEQRVEARTAELEAALRELEGFAYSVSHDLRAPLRNIAGFVQLARRRLRPDNPPEVSRQLGIVEAEAMRLSGLIDELLQFSRLGRRELHREPVALGPLVDEVRANDLHAETAGRSIAWTVGPLPVVSGDPTLLRQVVYNLLSNAVKFTRRTAVAAIVVETVPAAAGLVAFRVRDNGAGFDPRYAEKLFGVFQRLHSAREFEGTGIGLASVHRIVQRHGGTIRAEGKPGEGAAFVVTLPAA